jgi:hypothetical protein
MFIIALLFLVLDFFKMKELSSYMRVFAGYIQDLKVDKIIDKAVYLGEIASYADVKDEKTRVEFAVQKSCGIVADVMLQNNIDPKSYNLVSLILLSRTLKNFDISWKKEG